MKSIGDYIKFCIKEDGRTIKGISEKLNINYKTFTGKLKRDSLSADELFKICGLLDINLNQMKKDLNYDSMFEKKYVYAVIGELSEDELLNAQKVGMRKMEICEGLKPSERENIDIKHIFVPEVNSLGNMEYKLEHGIYHHLKDTGISGYMIRIAEGSNKFQMQKLPVSSNVTGGITNKR